MAHCNQRVRFAATWREEFFEVPLNFGGATGGADFHQKILQTATKASIFVEGICSGVKKTPDLFYEEEGVDQHSRKVDVHDKLADALMKYFDNFETHVQQDGVPVPILFETFPSYECVNAPQEPRIDLSEFDSALTDAEQLDDELDHLLSKVNYMDEFAQKWNPPATRGRPTSTVIADLRKQVFRATAQTSQSGG
jgi:hypothetical protein